MYRPQQSQRENHRGTGNGKSECEEGYWPHGLQEAVSLPVVDLDGSLDETLPRTPRVLPMQEQRAPWKASLGLPLVQAGAGLLIGVGLLFLVSRFVDFPAALAALGQHLTTPRGIILALLTGFAA